MFLQESGRIVFTCICDGRYGYLLVFVGVTH